MTEAERAAALADEIETRGWVDLSRDSILDDELAGFRLIVAALRTYSAPISIDEGLREAVALSICNSERGPNPKFHLKSFDDELAWSIGADMYRHKADAALSAIHASGRRIVPAEPLRKFALGDRVTKPKGSSWTGHVCGYYSTKLTPVGYNVESENDPGSVQIYPEDALAAKEPTHWRHLPDAP